MIFSFEEVDERRGEDAVDGDADAVEGEPDLIDEMHNMRYNKAKGHPAFSPKMICYCLLLRYASAQAYRILLDILPMPSIKVLAILAYASIGTCVDCITRYHIIQLGWWSVTHRCVSCDLSNPVSDLLVD